MSAFPLSSARLSKLRIICLNNLLDGDVYVKMSVISIFLFLVWFSNMILSDALILPVGPIPVSNTASNDVTN